ncbi:PQQ-binding-like beta-propeller repeat protein [Tessaracoccus caeni]|uniref:PQQ-binding-like beta-propeller repeat protein n=1 Tax=Tessaracoccus caeni TaxID=3031239 RepID=UPI0023DBF479|nr:PQQ-binding-like beta-propeller repeat protein [Tessaracoccus caeni]MDF1487592.1 hypothetical protein [Tessaracoccus caeni]
MIDDDQMLLERIGEQPQEHAPEPMSRRRRLLIVTAFVATLAILAGAVAGYDAWQNRGGDGYLEGIPSEPEVAWELSVPVRYGGMTSFPFMAVGDEALLIGPGFDEAEDAIRLISLDTGEEIWRHRLPDWAEPDDGLWAPFANEDGSVLGYGLGNRLVLLDSRTGEVADDVALGDPLDMIVDAAARGTDVYVGRGTSDGEVLARLDARRLGGGPIWEVTQAQPQGIGDVDGFSGFPSISEFVQARGEATGELDEFPWLSSICLSGQAVSFGRRVVSRADGCLVEALATSVFSLELGERDGDESEKEGEIQVMMQIRRDHQEAFAPLMVLDAISGDPLPAVDIFDTSRRHLIGPHGIVELDAGPFATAPSLAGVDGAEIWTSEVEADEASVGTPGILLRAPGRVTMLDEGTGEARWEIRVLATSVAATRLGPVLVSSGDATWHDGDTGRELSRWTPPPGSAHVVGESRRQVIVRYDGFSPVLQAFDASGVLLWERPVAGEALVRGSALLVYDGSTLSRLRSR